MLFKALLKVIDWIEANSVLFNCFLGFVRKLGVSGVGKFCVMEEVDGKPLIKTILKKTQELSEKPPHTETNLALMRNGLAVLKIASQWIETRIILKSSKIFQILELMHPQLYANKKTTWDVVTVEWLEFFEFISRYDDTECLPK